MESKRKLHWSSLFDEVLCKDDQIYLFIFFFKLKEIEILKVKTNRLMSKFFLSLLDDK